jgi:hypothetical protein
MVGKPAPLETQGIVKKSSRLLFSAGALIVLLIVSAMGVYAWYYSNNPCEVDAVEQASAILVNQMKRYDDIYGVTTSAPRNLLVRPVTDLQLVLMDTQGIDVPPCMRTAKNELINYMGTVIRAFQAYGAGESDATVRGLLDDSHIHINNFITELEAVRECAPFCIP